ncbi:hypothetical protein ACOSQ4_017670 [Xanthoceras sorbifolium]
MKGSQNLIPDMFSRPKPTQLITPLTVIPLVYAFSPTMASSSKPSSSYDASTIEKLPARQTPTFPPSLLAELPHDKTAEDLKNFAIQNLPRYLANLHEQEYYFPAHLQTNRPFLNLFRIRPYLVTTFTHNTLWYLWCLSLIYSHYVAFPLMDLYHHLHEPEN